MDLRRAVATYRTAMMISVALNILVGVFILLAPYTYAHVLSQPDPVPATWPRHWGAQLIAINLLYLPGFWDPVRNRYQNVLGILIRLSFAVFFFSQGNGFITMGIYDLCFGLLLAFTYWRVRRAAEAMEERHAAGAPQPAKAAAAGRVGAAA